jgi:hypothetical protein
MLNMRFVFFCGQGCSNSVAGFGLVRRPEVCATISHCSVKTALLVLPFSFVTGTQSWLKALALPSFGHAKEK